MDKKKTEGKEPGKPQLTQQGSQVEGLEQVEAELDGST